LQLETREGHSALFPINNIHGGGGGGGQGRGRRRRSSFICDQKHARKLLEEVRAYLDVQVQGFRAKRLSDAGLGFRV